MALIRQAGTFTDRFGNTVDIATGDNADTLLGSGDAYVTANQPRVLTTAGIVYAIGRTIRLEDGGAIRQASNPDSTALGGRHIYFINCNIIFETGAGLGPGTAQEAARAFSGHVDDGQANTTSINFVGCDATFEGATTTLQTVSTDWIDSNVRVTNQFAGFNFVFNRNPGSRTENTLIETVATTVQEWNFYGNPETLTDVVLSGFRLRTGSGAGDQTVLAPNLLFGNLTPNDFYSFNAGSGANPGFHHPGFTFIASAIAPLALTSRADQFGGNTFVVNHYGYDPTFYGSGLLTDDSLVENVRVRLTSNANIVNRTGTNVAASIAASAKAQTTINEFLTNAQGRMVSNQYSVDGGNNFNPGYFDYTQSLNMATVGATSFGATQAGQSVADGVGIFPLQVWRAGTGFDTTNNVEVRSYSHDINVDNDLSLSDYSVGDFIPIDTTNIVGPSIAGTRVKPVNVVTNGHVTKPFIGTGAQTAFPLPIESTSTTASDFTIIDNDGDALNLGTFTVATASSVTTVTFTTAPTDGQRFLIRFPVSAGNNSEAIAFDGNQTASPNDFANIARAAWAAFSFDPEFTGTSLRPASGPFDERTWPVRVIVDNTPHASSQFYQGIGFGVDINSNQLRVRINCSGVQPDPFNDVDATALLTSYNGNDTPLNLGGVTLNTNGGCVNVTAYTDAHISNSGSGQVEFTPINDTADMTAEFATGETRVTGTCSFSQLSTNSAARIQNLPPRAGRIDGSDSITLVNGRLSSAGNRTFNGVTYTGTGDGIYDNSRWTGVTTMSTIDYGQVRNWTIEQGCSLEGEISIESTIDATWTFNALPTTLNLDLPTQSNLIRIETGATSTESTVRDGVKVWLDAQVTAGNIPGYSELRADETAPTSGYWLVGAPLADRPKYTFQLSSPVPGRLVLRDVTGSTNLGIVKNVTTETSVSIELDGNIYEDDNEFKYYWSPLNEVTGSTDNKVYIPTIGTFTFEQGNQSVANTEVASILEDGALSIQTGVTFTAVRNATQCTITISGSTEASSAAQSLATAIRMVNDENVFDTIVANNLDTGMLDFGLNNGTNWINQGTTPYAMAFLRFQTGEVQSVSLPNTDQGADPGNTTVNAPNPQIFSNWSFQKVREDRGAVEVSSIPEGSLTAQQAAIAVGTTIGPALEPITSTLENSRTAFNANPILTAPGQEWAE